MLTAKTAGGWPSVSFARAFEAVLWYNTSAAYESAKKEEWEMFNVGDYIIYGSNGVCRVEAVGVPEISALKKSGKTYYTLCPVGSTETIYIPVDTKIFMRPIIGREEAEELIEAIPTIDGEVCYISSPRVRSDFYKEFMDSHECEDLVKLIKSIYAKGKSDAGAGKTQSSIDKRFMEKAEKTLYSELSLALGISEDDVVDYIADRCSSKKSREN